MLQIVNSSNILTDVERERLYKKRANLLNLLLKIKP